MKTRSTLLLLVVALGLYGFIHFYASKKPGTRERMEKASLVTAFDRADVKRIVITRRDTKIILALKDDQWEIQEPIQDRVDNSLMTQALTTLERISHYQAIAPGDSKNETREALSEFGLKNPKMRIEFHGKKDLPTLLIGREAAVENRVYLALDGSDTAYVVDIAVRDALNRQPDDFRDPQMLNLPATQVERVLLRTRDGQIELQKDGEDWDLLRPIRARVNTGQLAEMIRGATTVRMVKFICNDSEDLAPYGLAEPRGSVSLFTQREEETVSFDIGNLVEETKNEDGEITQPGGVYARYAKRNAVFLLPREVDHFVTTQPADLRDKRLLRLNLDIVDRVTLALAGASPFTLVRDREDWVIDGKPPIPANASEIIQLLNRLRTEEAATFVADTASDLAKYGLDDPQLRITISSYASENVPEQGAGEHPLLHLAFGKTEGDLVYARLEEEPFIVAVRKDLLADIPVDPILWKALPVFTYDLEAITHISRAFADATVTLDRVGTGEWKGDRKINQLAATSLSNTLSRLRAVRWVGETTQDHGLEKPEVLITFKTAEDEHTLRIGVEHENMRYATIGNGTFLLNRPDYESLVAALSENESSAN